MIRVSIVLATFEGLRRLQQSLPSLMGQDYPAERFEIIVVVDGSTDGTIDWLETLRPACLLTVLRQPNLGQAAAVNSGLRAARGQIALFLDDDILCEPNLVHEHDEAHRDVEPSLVYGPVLVEPGKASVASEWMRGFCDEFFAGLSPQTEGEGWYRCMGQANSSAPRRLLLEAGGMDEQFRRASDVELGHRLARRGLRFRYRPTAVVRQLCDKPSRTIVEDAKDEARARIVLCRKDPTYRSRSGLGSMATGSLWRRAVRRVIAEAPVSLEPALRVPSWFAERLSSFRAFRRAGVRLLDARRFIAASRCTIDELGGWNNLLREFSGRLAVLMYHNVGPQPGGGDPALTISAPAFQRQMQWLADRGYKTVTPSDWLAWQRLGTPLPPKPVLLTFDDAYRQIAQSALPTLSSLGFTATIFVVTNEIGGSNRWDQAAGYSRQELMSAEQIRDWANRGMNFGSHTRTHPDLRTLAPKALREELASSREDLSAITRAPVDTLAYPYGYYHDDTVSAAAEFFAAAFTCDPGLNDWRSDPHRMRRAAVVPAYDWMDPRWHLRVGFNPLVKWRMDLGRRRRQLFRGKDQ